MLDVSELTLVANELPIAIWMGRVPSGEVVYTNAAFREVLGVEPPAGAARGTFVEPYGVHTTTGEPYPEDKMPFERAIAARATVVVEDIVIHRRDGRRVSLRVFAKPLFDANGEMTHVLEAFTDITREVEAEKARVESDRRMARSQRLEAIGQLVAGISHDFNNLLTVTKLALSWLLPREREPEKVEALEQIAAVTDSAVQLIKNLIAFARRERQVAAPVTLHAAVRTVLDMAERTFDRRIALRAELDAEGAQVVADASQLEQIIMNLVLNARDAIEHNGEVVVRARAAGAHVVLEVRDTGCGVAPAIRDRVFEPYFTTKTQGTVKGTGLGLSTVHGIVSALGGSIDIEDNEPRGTIMRVTLPRAVDSPRAAPPGRNTSESGTATDRERSGGGRLVLVVDDEPLVRASMGATLASRGFRVIDAPDGATAIELLSAQRDVSAVVLDMVMPGMRCEEVLTALRKVRADTPVLIVTGSALDDDEGAALRALGASGVLAKPCDAAQLIAGLESVTAR